MEFSDAFVNLVTGLGSSKDKNTYGQFTYSAMTSKAELDAAYRSDWLAGTIVDAPPDDMTREWRTWHAGPRQVRAIEATERTLQVRKRVNMARKMARLYGGAALLIGDGAADPSLPLVPERVKKGGIKYLHALSRWEIWTGQLCRDPFSEFFGEPEYYMLNAPEQGGVQIHPSRVVRFLGTPWLELTYTMDGWGFPIVDRVYEAIRNVASGTGNMASMTHEGKLDIIKIKGLTQNVQDAGYRNRLLARFALANLNKSTNNALILDAEEDWQQKTINLSNMPEAIRVLLEVAAGAANMPVTRLLGTSPKGLNATGQSELRNYYDMLAGQQVTELGPSLDRLDQMLVRSALGTFPDDCHYEWNPLWQMTEAEQAAIEMQLAQRDQIYATSGCMAPSAMRKAITNGLLKRRVYPGLENALEEFANEPPAPLIVKKETTANEIDTPSSTARAVKTDAASIELNPALYKPAQVAMQDAAPRTLYVSRPVQNAAEIIRWAKKQGIPNVMLAKDLHVTLAYSHEPVDWFRCYGDAERIDVPAGGPRLVEPLGGEGAVVLLFASELLTWRWQHFRDIGAEWRHGEQYQPHLTLSWGVGNFDLSKVQPYTGPIVLGPERFAEIDQDWKKKVKR